MFWEQHEVVTHQNGYQGPHFKTTRGITQGRLISPTLFKLIVDNLVCNWLALMLDDQLVAYDGLVLALGRCIGIFYANGCMLVLRGPEWLQVPLNVIIGLFRRYRLVANVTNSKAMTCHLDAL